MPLEVNIYSLQDLAVIITQNSKIKHSLFVASSGSCECERAIDESENTGGFHIFILFYFIRVIIISFFKTGIATLIVRIGFNLISIGEY
jgi:type IV secretory pathway TrbL component